MCTDEDYLVFLLKLKWTVKTQLADARVEIELQSFLTFMAKAAHVFALLLIQMFL